MKMTTHYLLTFILALASFSCSPDKSQNLVPDFIELNVSSVDFKSPEANRDIKLETNNSNIEISIPAQGAVWCSAKVIKDTKSLLRISVGENGDREIRETTITLKAGTAKAEVVVKQLGQEAAILISPDIFSVNSEGGAIDFEITTNVEVEVQLPEWVQILPKTYSDEMVSTPYACKVSRNIEEQDRNGEILVKEKNGTTQAKAVITQKGFGEYAGADLSGLKDDVKLKVSTATASSFQSGSGIEKSFDGDKNSLYHSNWSNSGADYFPIELTYNFQDEESLDYLVYYPRASGSNGNFKEIEVWISTEEEPTFTKMIEKDCKGSGSATRIAFDKRIEKPKAVRFIVKSGSGDGQGFAACAEMEFYRANPDNYDASQLFSDKCCSVLKPGITAEMIEACPNAFYRNIAYYLFADKYPKEFRIAEFKAYEHPDKMAAVNKTSPYSLLDNATGISVRAGEELVVFAENLYGRTVSLKVQNLDAPGADGYGGASYPLAEGMNKLKMSAKGLVYVMYHCDDYETAAPVKLHFATGVVNGYYDSQKHTPEKGAELLMNAKDQYFDVLGKYAHLTFPTARFRNHTTSLKNLIDLYDDLVFMEMDFMGLRKYGKVFKNRSYFHVIYTSYMYATSYRTAYNDNTLGDLCNEERLRTSPWGPAHEVGHCNQTRPQLKWVGTTECTNNIHSMYVQTQWGNVSRLQGEDMSSDGFTNRYEKAMTATFTTNGAHGAEGDVFCKLVPFWQLQLYVGEVLGKADFYKDVYEMARVNPNPATNGACQLEFTVLCSDAAKLDLTDFFERWGFYAEINEMIDDYGVSNLTVTQEAAQQVIARIKAKGYPKPSADFEYITDRTVDVYRANAAVQKGSAVREGRTLTMSGWKNVAAYEVYKAGKLIFVSAESSFKIKEEPDNTFQVYAIAANGEKTLVTF